jgi:hypothetical protein
MSSPIYYVHDAGGMCNRLFPFAHLLAFSQETQRPLFNPVFGHLAEYFVGTNPQYSGSLAQCSGHESVLPRLSLPVWRVRFKIARNLASHRVAIRTEGELLDLERIQNTGEIRAVQWISALYAIHNAAFQKHRDLIRSYFRPIPPIESAVQQHIAVARKNVDILVGVHIRHGDYATHSGGHLFFEVSEFRELMDRMVNQLPGQRIGFLVCSNEPQPGEAFTGLVWRKGPGTEIGDLMALASCDYIIGPASTYSQWASFYGQVPCFVHNRKYEEQYGIIPTELALKQFRIHGLGYGKFQPS